MTIIRRKYTRNFTVMNREVFQDERLSLPALGVLCFLRSLPDDWTVSQDYLRTRFDVGKDKMQAIFRELAELGWIHRQTKRAGGRGTFAGSDYVVNDEPAQGPPQPENQAAVPEPGLPAPAEPGPVEPAPENPAAYLEGTLPNRDSTPSSPPAGGKHSARKIFRGNGISVPIAPDRAANKRAGPCLDAASAERFARLWSAYPPAALPHNDRDRAERYFAQLPEADQQLAIVAARNYATELGKSRLQAKGIHTWLRRRRFRNFATAAAAPVPAKVFVAEDSPAWAAWQSHLRSTAGRCSPVSESGGTRGWWFDSEWPPAAASAA